MKGYVMKAIAVYPGKPNSMHLEDVPMPKIMIFRMVGVFW